MEAHIAPGARAIEATGVGSTPEHLGAAWYALGVLVAAYLMAYVDKQVIAIAAAQIGTSLSLTDPQIGMVLGLGAAIFAPLAIILVGFLADRFSRPLILAIGISLWSAATAACGLSQTYNQLLVASIVRTVGEATLVPIAYALIPDVFPRRLWVTGNIVFFVSALLGISIGLASASAALDWFSRNSSPWVASLGEPWRITMVAVALPGPLLSLMTLFIRTRYRATVDTQDDADRLGLVEFARITWKALAPLLLAKASLQVALGGLFAWLVVALPRQFDIAATRAGYDFSIATAVGSVLGVGAAFILSRRFADPTSSLGPLKTALGTFSGLIFISPLILAATSAGQVVAVAGVIIGLAMGASSLLPGLVQILTPSHLRGRASAAFALVQVFGFGLGSLLVGAVSGTAYFEGDALAAIAAVNIASWLVAAVAINFTRLTMPAALEKVQ
ncbi:MFS transporter [Sphingopyxis chilensis]|uniref:MFS transporter n=1 Tax=Sphingopyxis chilensis TaxID=180400 RepID=UPI002DDD6622|nr:MFS transporter [Sphingopyxis chilensis]